MEIFWQHGGLDNIPLIQSSLRENGKGFLIRTNRPDPGRNFHAVKSLGCLNVILINRHDSVSLSLFKHARIKFIVKINLLPNLFLGFYHTQCIPQRQIVARCIIFIIYEVPESIGDHQIYFAHSGGAEKGRLSKQRCTSKSASPLDLTG